MRTTTVIFLVLLLAGLPIHAKEEKNDKGYAIAGASIYGENYDQGVGEGIGYKLGYGYKFNESFGIELSLDTSNPVDPKDLIQSYEDRGVPVFSYDIKTYANRYLTSSVVYTVPLKKERVLFGKLGWSVYWQKMKGEINGASFSSSSKLSDPRVEVGMQFPLKDDVRLNVALSHVFSDDAEATGVSCYMQKRF